MQLPGASVESGQLEVLSCLKKKGGKKGVGGGWCSQRKHFGSSSAMGNFQTSDFLSVPV